jgi:nitroreductase
LSVVTGRATWRGAFRDLDTAANEAVARLAAACPECIVIAERPSIAAIAALFDEASMHFLRQSEHRAELLRWMRLSRRHPDYALDGLNAEAMAMSGIEARAAGLVLGPLFRPLDALGLAARLSSEAGKTKSAAAIVLLHRPQDEDPFETGRQFYRAWLGFERAGLKACPMSVLADWDLSRARLAQAHGVPEGRRIVGVFRIGVPQGAPQIRRFRLPVESLLV